MPWKQTSALMERARFVRELASGEWTMSELCKHHGVSRPTGYKWARRFEADGDARWRSAVALLVAACGHRHAVWDSWTAVRRKAVDVGTELTIPPPPGRRAANSVAVIAVPIAWIGRGGRAYAAVVAQWVAGRAGLGNVVVAASARELDC